MSNGSNRRHLTAFLAKLYNQFCRAHGGGHTEKYPGASKYNPLFIQSVSESWHAKEKNHRKHEKIYWYVSLGLTFAVAVFTGFGAVFAYNAYCQAKRQADAAVDQVVIARQSAPRAWLYIEFASPLDEKTETIKLNNANPTINISTVIPVHIHNYGIVPATINSVKARLITNRGHQSHDFLPTDIGDPQFIVTESQLFQNEYEGTTIAPSGDAPSVVGANFQLVNLPEDFVYHKTRWVLFQVSYSDPFGSNRETAYFGKISGSLIKTTGGKSFNFRK